jgi:CheY-like chemotaxis protein
VVDAGASRSEAPASTAGGTHALRRRSEDAGFADHLVEPIAPEKLLRALDQVSPSPR